MEARLSPMLCSDAEQPIGDDWALEPKLDGWRIIATVADPTVQIYARRGAKHGGKLTYLEDELRDVLPPNTALDGELVGASFEDVGRVLKRNSVHIPSSGLRALSYVVFDVTMFAGEDLRDEPWSYRRSVLERIEWRQHALTIPVDEATVERHEAMLALGLEGTVTKRKDSLYESGLRSPAWVRNKPQATAEAVVVGFKPGEGDFTGLVGALEVEMVESGAKTHVGTGFDLTARQGMTTNPEEWLGLTIELRHHGIGKSGKPRHPAFHRRRDDALPKPKPKPKPKPSTAPASRRQRNYKQMLDEKLVRSVRELRAGHGEAFEKAERKHTGHANELALAEAELSSRGLTA